MLVSSRNGFLRLSAALLIMVFLLSTAAAPPRASAFSPDEVSPPNLTLSDPVSSYRPAADGAQRTSDDQPTPKHAYSPFDEPEPTSPLPEEIVPGQVLIKFKASAMSVTRGGSVQPNSATLKRLSETNGVSDLQKVFPTVPAASTRSAAGTVDRTALTRWYTAKVSPGADIPELARSLAQDAAVEVAEPEYIRRPAALPDAASDPRIGEQWYLDAINAPAAWQFLADHGIEPGGRRDIIIAVIDTGVDYTHPDLAGNMWTNAGEIPANGIDDDHNGFVDDIHGANVVSNQHSGDPMDDHGHGTHVAGIIAGQGNNGTGIVGVAYNTQIMALKAAQYSGVLSTTDIAEAIYYAIEKGADVINMSFGGYSKSQIEEDALAVAFGQAVLVAAAGNDGFPNEPPPRVTMYPAAYNWVLGVMAADPTGARAAFSNFDVSPHNTIEYEVLAPGVDILSTLPGNRYAFWDGTSMAAPVVSGIAALVRSYFWDKNLYSSRFVMGQIATQGADAYAALTETPQPELRYLEHWLFDTAAQGTIDDNDGIVDAGETIDLAIIIRNHWGKAENVNVTLQAHANGAIQDDPYVTFATNIVNYGAIGSFNWDDNGLIYSTDGAVTGVTNPFRFTVSPDCPNDHVIPFLLTMTCANGLDSTDTAGYSFTSDFMMVVQRGRELPRIISENTTLTKDYYWIVPGQTIIAAGVTVIISEGTQVQWGSPKPSDPYNEPTAPTLRVNGTLSVAGTLSEPVDLFPSPILGGQVDIAGASVNMNYVRIQAPFLDVNSIDHGYISGPHPTGGGFRIRSLTNSIIDKLGYGSGFGPLGTYMNWYVDRIETSLVDNAYVDTHYRTAALPPDTKNNVFLSRSGAMFGITFGVSNQEEALANTRSVNNAFLNRYWDLNINHWVRLAPYAYGSMGIPCITHNYFGTTDSRLIDATILDFNDNIDLSAVYYQPFLTTPAETTYPFVWKVVITQGGVETNRLGPGEATFTVTFNRDMDTAKPPQASFGPDVPMTDYTLHPIDGGWQDARTWAGTFNINPITGDGYQLIRIAGARAASDHRLVTGDDAGRFRFEIITSGTEAMNLQATGAEGRVDLMWTQDDFDLLAGYNLYRAESANGSYTRVNSALIPSNVKSYRDTVVQPGKPYFYKFTVVKTDMTESDFSNVASGTPLDTIAPVITHTPITASAPGLGLQVYADVTDNVRVATVNLKHRHIGDTVYQTREMVKTTGNRYSATLEGSLVTAPGVEYYIEATDGISIVRSGRADLPHRVNVVDSPKVTSVSPNRGPIAGGTAVTITGTNFKAGAGVTFGGAVAGDVALLSSSQINCTTPPHAPGVVDVSVINPDQAADTLLRGFTYESEVVSVSLPDAHADASAIIEIPVTAENVQGLRAAYVKVTFNGAVLSATGARTGSITPGFSLDANTTVPGEVRLALASASGVSGTGALAYIEFLVTGVPSATSDLTLAEVALNDGAIPVTLDNGVFTVEDLLTVSGRVLYHHGGRPVSGVTMTMSGNQVYTTATDESGTYLLRSIPTGTYSLTPAKSGEPDAITAYDASLILRHTTGSLTLSGYSLLAADVDRGGTISPMDASYVLEKAVGLIDLPFPGAGKVWDFVPAERRYTPLTADVTGQDFTAILIGDVSGNWHDGGIQSAQVRSAPAASLTIPDVPASPQGRVTVPLCLEVRSGQVYSADLVVSYDPTKMSVASVSKSALGSAFSMAVNLSRPGEARIAMASATPISSDGKLLTMTLDVVAGGSGVSPLRFSLGSLNEGALTAALSDGSVTVAIGRILQGVTKSGNIRRAPQAYENWTVTIGGEYGGWESGYGVAPVTRSDWVIRDETGAIYVTGVNPMRHPDDLGQAIGVTGIVRVKNGQPYIEIPRSGRR